MRYAPKQAALSGRVIAELFARLGIDVGDAHFFDELFWFDDMGNIIFDEPGLRNVLRQMKTMGEYPLLLPSHVKLGRVFSDLVTTGDGKEIGFVRKLWPNGLKSLKEQTYVSLLLSKCLEVLYASKEEALAVESDVPVNKKAAMDVILSSAAELFRRGDVARYETFLNKHMDGVETLKDLAELFHDGFNPMLGIGGVVQVRAVIVRSNGTTLGKGTAGDIRVISDIYRALGITLKMFCMNPSNVKVTRDGDHILSLLVKSEVSKMSDARGRNVTLSQQFFRLLDPDVQFSIADHTGWLRAVADVVDAVNQCDLSALREALGVSDETTGLLGMLHGKLLRSKWSPVIASALAGAIHKLTYGYKVRGASRLLQSNPALIPFTEWVKVGTDTYRRVQCDGVEFSATPIIVPKGTARIGDVVVCWRDPVLLPGAVVVAVVVDYSENHVTHSEGDPLPAMVNPFVVRWLMEGDHDGDDVRIMTLDIPGSVLARISQVNIDAFEAFANGVSDDFEMAPRADAVTMNNLVEMARDVVETPITKCDPMISAIAEYAHAAGVTSNRFVQKLGDFMLVGKAIDQSKKAPVQGRLTLGAVADRLLSGLGLGDRVPKIRWARIRKSAMRAVKEAMLETPAWKALHYDFTPKGGWSYSKGSRGHLRAFFRPSIDDPNGRLHFGEKSALAATLARLTWVAREPLSKTVSPCGGSLVGLMSTLIRNMDTTRLFSVRGNLSIYAAVDGLLRDGAPSNYLRKLWIKVGEFIDKYTEAKRKHLDDGTEVSSRTIQEQLDELLDTEFSVIGALMLIHRCVGYKGRESMFVTHMDCMMDVVPSRVWEIVSARMADPNFRVDRETLLSRYRVRPNNTVIPDEEVES